MHVLDKPASTLVLGTRVMSSKENTGKPTDHQETNVR